MSMQKLISILFLVVFGIGFVSISSVVAQTDESGVSLQSLEVDFWPEYDRPAMLVIYRAELDPSVPLPTDVTFRIPAHVGTPHAVAAGQTNDSLFTISADRQVDGEWAYITFNTAMPIVRLEYYDSELNVNDPDRMYEYNWAGDYALQQLLLQVQQPCDATNMQIAPSLGSGVVGADGLTYFTGSFGALNQGQEFELSIGYTKNSDCLSISSLEIVDELPENTPGRVTFLDYLPVLLGLLGVILIVGGVLWYWQTGRQKSALSTTRRGRRASTSQSSKNPELLDEEQGSVIYCHNCGKRANPNDKFCRSCGTRLRNQ